MLARLLSAATAAPTTGRVYAIGEKSPNRVYQASVAGTGAVSATVEIWVSADNSNFVLLATITLSGTTSDSDGLASLATWPYVRADLTAISGTGATVNASVAAA